MMYDNQSNETLIFEIEGLLESIDANCREICIRLSALAERKYNHPLMVHPIFRHHRLVTTGQMIPGLLFKINGDKKRIEILKGLPEMTQESLNSNREQSIAVFNKKTGKISEERKPFSRMSDAELKRLFPGKGRIATFTEQQSELMNAEIERQRWEDARVENREKRERFIEQRKIVVGKREITIAELNAALAKIGFRADLIPGANNAGTEVKL